MFGSNLSMGWWERYNILRKYFFSFITAAGKDKLWAQGVLAFASFPDLYSFSCFSQVTCVLICLLEQSRRNYSSFPLLFWHYNFWKQHKQFPLPSSPVRTQSSVALHTLLSPLSLKGPSSSSSCKNFSCIMIVLILSLQASSNFKGCSLFQDELPSSAMLTHVWSKWQCRKYVIFPCIPPIYPTFNIWI